MEQPAQDEKQNEARPDLVWLNVSIGISAATAAAIGFDVATSASMPSALALAFVGSVVTAWCFYAVNCAEIRLERRIEYLIKRSHDAGYDEGFLDGVGGKAPAGGHLVQLRPPAQARSGRDAG